MYPAVSTDDLLSIPIAVPDEAICKAIINKVAESRVARLESKQLLDQAKRAVELAIEQDETVALRWLAEQAG